MLSCSDAVDIEADREVVITPNGQNQVQPGGTVDYTHQLENNGNQDETVEITRPTVSQVGRLLSMLILTTMVFQIQY